MFLSAGVVSILAGIFCWTDTELAWRFYELDNQTWGQYVKQPKDWREKVRYMGVVLVLLGAIAIVAGVDAL